MPAYKPNLVLINGGTNDAIQNFRLDTIGDRMRELIDYLFEAVPTTCVVLSTLIPNKFNPAGVDQINDQYRQVAAQYRAAGKHVVLAEMAMGWVTVDDLTIPGDTTHPGDSGYKKMATRWTQAIGELEARGWLQAPSADVDFSDHVDPQGDNTKCNKMLGSGSGTETQVLRAASPNISDDGRYVHSSVGMGVIKTGSYSSPDTVWFAQLVRGGSQRGSEREDWIYSVSRLNINFRENKGNGVFGDAVRIPTLGGTCDVEGIRWGDVVSCALLSPLSARLRLTRAPRPRTVTVSPTLSASTLQAPCKSHAPVCQCQEWRLIIPRPWLQVCQDQRWRQPSGIQGYRHLQERSGRLQPNQRPSRRHGRGRTPGLLRRVHRVGDRRSSLLA